jgi:peptide/nickel transport system permease protein
MVRIIDSDIFYSYQRSPLVVVASVITLSLLFLAIFAPFLAPQNPFDPADVDLMGALTGPAWTDGGIWKYPLGTDDQGRCILSTIMHGSRISLYVGFVSVIFSIVLGTSLGLVSGYVGGWFETLVMRLADVQLTIPGLLVALMIDGIARASLSRETHDQFVIYVIILAIGLANWPQYARVTRSATLVEKNKDYIAAARVTGVRPVKIMVFHLLPNAIGGVLVLGTIGFAYAIVLEATLSFLGVGMSPTTPSLGTLIRVGNNYLFSGEWWITLFPSLTLVLLVLSVNVFGDWLRDALNPKLR